MNEKNPNAIVPLTDLPVPELVTQQVELFTPESIHLESLFPFDPSDAYQSLDAKDGHWVIGVDLGGDKITAQLFVLKGKKLVALDDYSDYAQGNHGEGYLECLVKTGQWASEHNVPVGISYGAPIDGTKPLYHPKIKQLTDALSQDYEGDLKNVVPTLTACLNDGPAGLISGAIEASSTGNYKNILFPINGGGFGLSIATRGMLYSSEAGHVQAAEALNTYGQTTPCGVFGATYTCLEAIGANKAGIETQWTMRTGETLRARDIEDRYKAGDTFAGELYEHSAWVLSHMLQGAAAACNIDLSAPDTVIVGHGGGFKFPNFGARVQQILAAASENTPTSLLLTKDYSDNACQEGAALAALLTN
ncbi:MAG: hypothetical protein JWM81_562 [Candidatus Saccharibacteria bacterium]|nr:hypothetical protein [Candidatus Saccharibacteria bacterium]